MDFNHITVLLEESIQMLNINPDGIYVDGTLGGGGHALRVCEKLSEKGLLIGIDRDLEALNAAKIKLSEHKEKTKILHDNFSNIKNILDQSEISEIDGAILDLGVSSHQLDKSLSQIQEMFHNPPRISSL